MKNLSEMLQEGTAIMLCSVLSMMPLSAADGAGAGTCGAAANVSQQGKSVFRQCRTPLSVIGSDKGHARDRQSSLRPVDIVRDTTTATSHTLGLPCL